MKGAYMASHTLIINQDMTRIVGCSCGWRTPVGTTDSDDSDDSDDTYSAHAAISRIHQREDKEVQ